MYTLLLTGTGRHLAVTCGPRGRFRLRRFLTHISRCIDLDIDLDVDLDDLDIHLDIDVDIEIEPPQLSPHFLAPFMWV